MLDAMKIIFEELGYDVVVRADAAEGLAEAAAAPFDLVLVDVRMPGKNGADLTERILRQRPGTRVLAVMSSPDDPLAARALKSGAVGLVQQPFEIARMLSFLKD